MYQSRRAQCRNAALIIHALKACDNGNVAVLQRRANGRAFDFADTGFGMRHVGSERDLPAEPAARFQAAAAQRNREKA